MEVTDELPPQRLLPVYISALSGKNFTLFLMLFLCYTFQVMTILINDDLVNKIKETSRIDEIDLAVLHGSHAKGITRKRSDIDFAVRSKIKRIDSQYFMKVLGDFTGIFGDKLDLVFLNEAPPMLKYRIAVYGKLLFEEREGLFEDFKVESSHFYADTKKFRDMNSFFINGFLKGVIPVVR